ncbi:MAG TPA: DUF4446 family protein [Chloroflexota bacterium]|nr:DUF4446 family protein [Chloroflexota bacterium]
MGNALDQHPGAAIAVICVVVLVLLIWLYVVHRKARRVEARLEAVLGGLTGDNTARALAEYLGTVRATATEVQRIGEQHRQIMGLMPSVVRHVGLVRFSPFHDTGGDQSFALALLDGRADGVVITGLHSRHDSRLYAKPIEHGSSSYSLTPEERRAMEIAIHGERSSVPS